MMANHTHDYTIYYILVSLYTYCYGNTIYVSAGHKLNLIKIYFTTENTY